MCQVFRLLVATIRNIKSERSKVTFLILLVIKLLNGEWVWMVWKTLSSVESMWGFVATPLYWKFIERYESYPKRGTGLESIFNFCNGKKMVIAVPGSACHSSRLGCYWNGFIEKRWVHMRWTNKVVSRKCALHVSGFGTKRICNRCQCLVEQIISIKFHILIEKNSNLSILHNI